jgi:hypothetical protein
MEAQPPEPAFCGASRGVVTSVEAQPVEGVICSTCGGVAAGPSPLNWSAAVEAGHRVWTCDRCARDHLRSIEAKLDSAWW